MMMITLRELMPLVDKDAILHAVRSALIAHSKGQFQSPMPGELRFPESCGDCHIKFGHRQGAPTFAIKVSTGFYNNKAENLAVNNGLTLVFDAATGVPKILFQDEGWLTSWRTVAATVLAVGICRPKTDCRIGIVGTGQQGQMAAGWLRYFYPQAQIEITGRNTKHTQLVASDLGVAPCRDVSTLLAQNEIIITTTPSKTPLFEADLARPGMHFIGLGTDSCDKAELPVGLYARAAHIVIDDYAQCLALSDFGKAVRAGVIDAECHHFIGQVLEAGGLARNSNDISIVDLTGLAAQDIAIAALFAAKLSSTAVDGERTISPLNPNKTSTMPETNTDKVESYRNNHNA